MRRNSAWMRPDVDTMQGRKAKGEGEGRVPRSVGLAVFMDLGAGHVFQSSVGISIAKLAISANMHHVISTELMDHSDVDDEVLVSTQVSVLDQYNPLSPGAVRHVNLWKFGSGVGKARLR